MKSNRFINKIKIYSVVAFLLPLLAINSCLSLYKLLGNIDSSNADLNWDERKIEVAINSKDNNDFTFVNCPKYKYRIYLLTVDNKLLLAENESGFHFYEKEEVVLYKNNKVKSEIYEQGEIINYRCIKNYKYLMNNNI